jgi:hypothetical protein
MQFASGDSFGTKLSLLCKFPPLAAGSRLCLGTVVGTSASPHADLQSHQGPISEVAGPAPAAEEEGHMAGGPLLL